MKEDQLQELLRLYASGLSGEEVAERLGTCTPGNVRYHAQRAGILRRRVPVCPRRHAEIVQWCQEGRAMLHMISELETNHATLERYIRRQKIPYAGFSREGANNPAWKGGRQVDKHGYILVLQKDHPQANRHGYVREHRLVMEQTIGRPLTRREVVDHLDGDPGNNDPANLRLFASNAEHLRATLTGVPCPARANRYGPTPTGKGTGGSPLPGKTRQRLAAHGKAARRPSRTAPPPEPAPRG